MMQVDETSLTVQVLHVVVVAECSPVVDVQGPTRWSRQLADSEHSWLIAEGAGSIEACREEASRRC
jgi:hypothetical protein